MGFPPHYHFSYIILHPIACVIAPTLTKLLFSTFYKYTLFHLRLNIPCPYLQFNDPTYLCPVSDGLWRNMWCLYS